MRGRFQGSGSNGQTKKKDTTQQVALPAAAAACGRTWLQVFGYHPLARDQNTQGRPVQGH